MSVLEKASDLIDCARTRRRAGNAHLRALGARNAQVFDPSLLAELASSGNRPKDRGRALLARAAASVLGRGGGRYVRHARDRRPAHAAPAGRARRKHPPLHPRARHADLHRRRGSTSRAAAVHPARPSPCRFAWEPPGKLLLAFADAGLSARELARAAEDATPPERARQGWATSSATIRPIAGPPRLASGRRAFQRPPRRSSTRATAWWLPCASPRRRRGSGPTVSRRCGAPGRDGGGDQRPAAAAADNDQRRRRTPARTASHVRPAEGTDLVGCRLDLGLRSTKRSAVRRAVGPETERAATTSPAWFRIGTAAAARPSSRSPNEVLHPVARDLPQLSLQLLQAGRARRERLGRHATKLLALHGWLGECQQQLARGANGQGERLPDLREVTQLVLAVHGRDAHSRYRAGGHRGGRSRRSSSRSRIIVGSAILTI